MKAWGGRGGGLQIEGYGQDTWVLSPIWERAEGPLGWSRGGWELPGHLGSLSQVGKWYPPAKTGRGGQEAGTPGFHPLFHSPSFPQVLPTRFVCLLLHLFILGLESTRWGRRWQEA